MARRKRDKVVVELPIEKPTVEPTPEPKPDPRPVIEGFLNYVKQNPYKSIEAGCTYADLDAMVDAYCAKQTYPDQHESGR